MELVGLDSLTEPNGHGTKSQPGLLGGQGSSICSLASSAQAINPCLVSFTYA